MLEGMADFFVSGFVYPGHLVESSALGDWSGNSLWCKNYPPFENTGERCYIFGRQTRKLSQGFN